MRFDIEWMNMHARTHLIIITNDQCRKLIAFLEPNLLKDLVLLQMRTFQMSP